jgi:hypothetical protein
MGLDMYLFSLPKISGMDYDQIVLANRYLTEPENLQNEMYERVKPHIKHFEEFGSSWTSLFEEIAYWRKANQIHNWFVNTLHYEKDEPCFTVEVTKDQLSELHKLCVRVLKQKEHPATLLPTRPGCYFGNLSYDQYYYREIFETESLLAHFLENFNFDTHYLLYQCSW